jgi:hypothetical protein
MLNGHSGRQRSDPLCKSLLRNDLVDALLYRRLTAKPPDTAAVTVHVEPPILHVQLDLPNGPRLHVIDVHLKSKISTMIPGQKIDASSWRSAAAWADGSLTGRAGATCARQGRITAQAAAA